MWGEGAFIKLQNIQAPLCVSNIHWRYFFSCLRLAWPSWICQIHQSINQSIASTIKGKKILYYQIQAAQRRRSIYSHRGKLTLTSFPCRDHVPLSLALSPASHFHTSASSHNSDFHMKYSHAALATVPVGENSSLRGRVGCREPAGWLDDSAGRIDQNIEYWYRIDTSSQLPSKSISCELPRTWL